MAHSVVIGGAGFVGSWVVDEILKTRDSKVTIVDNLISSEIWNISKDPRVVFIEGSAAEFDTLNRIQTPVDFVYQLACFHGNQSSIARPLDDFENGLKTTLTTLEWVKRTNPTARVVYSGAGCAVAEKTWAEPVAVTEVDSTSLFHDSPYSISKITGEMYCIYYAKQQNLDVVRVRFQNVYGPKEILGAGIWRGTINTIWRNAIPTFIWKAINDIPITIFGDEEAGRDFVYVSDIAQGVIAAANLGKSGDVYNLASGIETKISDVVETILILTSSKSKIEFLPKRDWDNSGRRFGNPKKSTNEIGFITTVEFIDGLKDTIDWTGANRNLIESSMLKHQSNDI